MSLFSAVEMAPRDPILGLNEQFAADTAPVKVNLGVGVYFNDQGKLPLLECVQQAEHTMMLKPAARGYLPIDGIAAYDTAVKGLVFGADSEAVKSNRVSTVQALGGTGGLKIGADFLKKLNPAAKVMISDPSWENHRALFSCWLHGRNICVLRFCLSRCELPRHVGQLERRRSRHRHRVARLLPQSHRL